MTKLRSQNKAPATVTWGVAECPAGKLAVGLNERGEICRTAYLRGRKAADAVAEWQAQWPQTVFSGGAKVDDYMKRVVALTGTAFQQDVWKVMVTIPAGKTLTYGEVARRVGRPLGARAVGMACGANPVPYVVPCHRVVAACGLGGFSGGEGIKELLLKKEAI